MFTVKELHEKYMTLFHEFVEYEGWTNNTGEMLDECFADLIKLILVKNHKGEALTEEEIDLLQQF